MGGSKVTFFVTQTQAHISLLKSAQEPDIGTSLLLDPDQCFVFELCVVANMAT
jgi:hypothetical protein